MAGFSNDVMYANNVDFSGGKSATVTTDGQLLIGSTALPHIKVGTLTAGTGITITNGSGAITIASTASATDLHVAKLIVNPAANAGGNFTTISSALGSAVSGDTIFIMPGTYTENLTLKAGVNLTAFVCDSGSFSGATSSNVVISGTVTAPLTGAVSISGIQFRTSGAAAAIAIATTSAANLIFHDCYFVGVANTIFSVTSSDVGNSSQFFECVFDLTAVGIKHFAITSGAHYFRYCQFLNGGVSTTANTISNASQLQIQYCFCGLGISTSDTSSASIFNSSFENANTTQITWGGTGTNNMAYLCNFVGNTASAVSISAGCTGTIMNSSIKSSNTNAITGAGTLNYGGLIFSGSSSTINVTSQTVLNGGPSSTFGSANSGATNALQVTNSSNTASSRANVTASVGGTSSEDGSFSSVITGGQTWSWGGDNSDSDAFVISANASLGTTNVMRVATTGEINFPLQSCFLSIQASTATNATGDATNYTLGSTVDLTEIYDQNSDFDPTTGTYTAPITARVFLSSNITVTGGTAMTQINPAIVTSNRSYNQQSAYGAAAVVTNIGLTRESDCDMDAADTATATISIVDSGGKVDDIFGAATDQWTGFSGHIFA